MSFTPVPITTTVPLTSTTSTNTKNQPVNSPLFGPSQPSLTSHDFPNPDTWLRDGKHPLHASYRFWFLRRTNQVFTDMSSYIKNFVQVGPFDTVEDFWSIYSYLKRPSDTPQNGFTYHCFRSDLEPIWEHPGNQHGGRWVVKLKKGAGPKAFENALLAMIGDEFNLGDELCGIVLSLKKHGDDSIAFWNKSGQAREAITRLRDAIKRILGVGSNALEYRPHDQSIQKLALTKGEDLIDNDHDHDDEDDDVAHE